MLDNKNKDGGFATLNGTTNFIKMARQTARLISANFISDIQLS